MSEIINNEDGSISFYADNRLLEYDSEIIKVSKNNKSLIDYSFDFIAIPIYLKNSLKKMKTL